MSAARYRIRRAADGRHWCVYRFSRPNESLFVWRQIYMGPSWRIALAWTNWLMATEMQEKT